MRLSIRSFRAQPMLLRLTFTTLSLAAIVPVVAPAARAQVEAPFQNREERQLYNNGSGSGSVLDATNPMDLINRLRQSGAMNDATPPSDAVDEALKAFQTSPASTAP